MQREKLNAHLGARRSTMWLALVLALLGQRTALGADSYRARLSPMPLDQAMAATMTGKGAATASLSGSTLTLNATFEGLKTPATTAQLKKSAKPWMRGDRLFDLVVSKSTNGTLTATIVLTAQQVVDLQSGRLYVQIDSEKAPEGNLWGWLLPREATR